MPAKAGIQEICNYFKRLDYRFHGNDKKLLFRIYYELINFMCIKRIISRGQYKYRAQVEGFYYSEERRYQFFLLISILIKDFISSLSHFL